MYSTNSFIEYILSEEHIYKRYVTKVEGSKFDVYINTENGRSARINELDPIITEKDVITCLSDLGLMDLLERGILNCIE